MLGRRNIRDSIGYVTLGLFAHALLDELLEAKKKPEAAPVRKKMMRLAEESLEAMESPDAVEPSRWRNLVFQNYQESETLRTVLSAHPEVGDIGGLREILSTIVLPNATRDERLENIDKAMDFFAELARMAVINAECPEEQVPPGVRQLVAS